MKLWILSDLHLEFGGSFNALRVPDADVRVVAGDLLTGCSNSVRWLDKMVAPDMPVVFVVGNHEFYGHSVMEGLEWGRVHAAECPRVNFLENDAVMVGGVRFLGCSLWTDYALDGDPEFGMAMAGYQLNDHRRVMWRMLPERELFTPVHARALHVRSKHWLKRQLQQPFDGPTVVVTHHAPHPRSVNPRFKGSALNPAFASDLSEVIERWQPELWVHGHMHDSCDYMIGKTRVLCNPKGYESENAAFDPGLVVEV